MTDFNTGTSERSLQLGENERNKEKPVGETMVIKPTGYDSSLHKDCGQREAEEMWIFHPKF